MGKLKWNERLFWWIAEKIFKHPENQILPWHLFALRGILCPVSMLTWWMQRHWVFRYDMQSDSFVIYGMKYSGTLFRSFAEHGLPLDTLFEIIKREDQTITVRRHDNHGYIILRPPDLIQRGFEELNRPRSVSDSIAPLRVRQHWTRDGGRGTEEGAKESIP